MTCFERPLPSCANLFDDAQTGPLAFSVPTEDEDSVIDIEIDSITHIDLPP